MPSTLPVSYTTVGLVYETLPALKTQATTITSAEIALQAGQAQAYIDARLAQTYDLPLAAEVPVLTEMCTDFTVYRILVKRLYTAQQLENSPWPDRYKELSTLLDLLAGGDVPLLDTTGTLVTASSTQGEVWSDKMDYKPTFWEADDEFGPVVDPDKQQDEYDSRRNY
jgi:phage gp36-like protein